MLYLYMHMAYSVLHEVTDTYILYNTNILVDSGYDIRDMRYGIRALNS